MKFVTLFDQRYLERGLAMVESLLVTKPDAQISVLCLDPTTQSAVERFNKDRSIEILTLDSLDQDLIRRIKSDRDYREFCWTLASVLCAHHLSVGVPEVVYLDADILFFSSPDQVVEESRRGDLAAIRHRFPERLRDYEINGIFNVQWVYFKNSEVGKRAATRWADQCITCCAYLPELGIVGDQKYLDEWPILYRSFIDIGHLGAGVAPWNHEILHPRRERCGWVLLDDTPLVFFHFQGFEIGQSGKVKFAGTVYSQRAPLPRDLYLEYLERIRDHAIRFSEFSSLPPPGKWKLSGSPFFLLRRALQKLHR